MSTYFFEFEKTQLRFEQRGIQWVASLPCSAAGHSSLLLALSRTIANWYDMGCPPSGYPANAPPVGQEHHPLEICDPYERSAIARLLNVPDIDQVLLLVQRSILVPEASKSFRESRDFYRGLSKMLLLEVATTFPDRATSERVEIVGQAMAERFVEAYGMEKALESVRPQVSDAN